MEWKEMEVRRKNDTCRTQGIFLSLPALSLSHSLLIHWKRERERERERKIEKEEEIEGEEEKCSLPHDSTVLSVLREPSPY